MSNPTEKELPTDAEVQVLYSVGLYGENRVEGQREFRRWLAAHDRAGFVAAIEAATKVATKTPGTNVHPDIIASDIRALLDSLEESMSADREAFDRDTLAERKRQIEKGYTPAHDDEHGLDHLLMWAQEYAYRGEPIKSAAMIEAAREKVLRDV